MSIEKMKEEQTKAVRIWIHPGIILPGMTTNLSTSGGNIPNTTSTRTTDDLMGCSNAKVKGRLADVLETEVL